jgi:hypothetical protein
MRAVCRLGKMLVAGVVVLSGFAASSEAASVSVTAAIKGQDQAVRHSPVLKKITHFRLTTPAQTKKLVVDLQTLDGRLDHAATVVSEATALTAKQKLGQKEWVGGVRELANGFSQFAVELKDIERGDKTAAKQEAIIAKKTIQQGDALGMKGDRALGLPTSD